MRVFGEYFDGKSSLAHPVEITIIDDYVVMIAGEGISIKTTLDDIHISSRVGNTPRLIKLQEDAVIHVSDNDALDEAISGFWHTSTSAHKLESRRSIVIISIVIMLISVLYFIFDGSDKVAKMLAYNLPSVVEKKIGTKAFEYIDEEMLEPSKLKKERQKEISALFAKFDGAKEYTLHFRRGIGINAFALPSGDIVITDELIEFSDGNNDMIFGVLAHEIGHVKRKHSMQMIIKASMVGILVGYFTGDVSTLATTLMSSVVQAKYSREFEREADAFAKETMQKSGVDPKNLALFFKKMSKKEPTHTETGYFDSHPANQERIDALLAP